MPGWYIHTEVAKQVVERLQKGQVPPDFPGGAAAAKIVGDNAHKWRNYLAWGAIGPDIFYLLPDFKPPFPTNDLMNIINWTLQEWDKIDKLFMGSWGGYAAPAIRGTGNVLNQMSGGVIREVGETLQELSKACQDLVLGIVAYLADWFGLFSSGVQGGLSEKEFYWSDMFHYRGTYEFAQHLFKHASDFPQSSERLQAFALGWITHCATDVTGHPFVNQKVGGPWRLHWQRHHLVENHMDAKVYDTLPQVEGSTSPCNGVEPYGELDSSCLHFRLSFRNRNDDIYATSDGSMTVDAPSYDYFAGFPPYDGHNPLSGLDSSDSDAGDNNRAQFFDMDLGDLSDDFCKFLIQSMQQVFPDPPPANQPLQAPQILRCTDATFHNDDSGRPSEQAIKNTFATLFAYVKLISTSGYSPAPPQPPPVFNDHSPPAFPKPSEDKNRGGDTSDENSIVKVLFAIFGFLLWLADFAVWLITLPEAVIADLLTYPPRELLYLIAVEPLYSLYLAMRQPLVMGAFMHPKHSEISEGLVRLGTSSSQPYADLEKALSSVGVDPWPAPSPPTSEPSGRASEIGPAFEVDASYPRAIIEDSPTLIAKAVNYAVNPSCGQKTLPSEYLRPWKYPDANNAGVKNGSEGVLTHPGPWVQGQSAEILMNGAPGDASARADFENAQGPGDCEAFCEKHFPAGHHLGDPVDYSVYLVGRLTNPALSIPDFNLDSDRGYAYHTWDYDRNNQTDNPPACPKINPAVNFSYQEACTVPEGYCHPNGGGPQYEPSMPLSIHFEGQPNQQCIQFQEKKNPR